MPPAWIADKSRQISERLPYARKVALARVSDLFFPPTCPLSGETVAVHGTFSATAWQALQHLGPPWCEGCGRPFADDSLGPLCVSCTAPKAGEGRLIGTRRLDAFRSGLVYDDHLAKAILSFKYGDRHDGVTVFARLMAQVARDILPEGKTVLVMPVPLHRRRLRTRRFNQAGLLATVVARELELTVDHLSLQRIRPTPSQRGASVTERARRVSGAFAVSAGTTLQNTHILAGG